VVLFNDFNPLPMAGHAFNALVGINWAGMSTSISLKWAKPD
jgi:hypothetical protein